MDSRPAAPVSRLRKPTPIKSREITPPVSLTAKNIDATDGLNPASKSLFNSPYQKNSIANPTQRNVINSKNISSLQKTSNTTVTKSSFNSPIGKSVTNSSLQKNSLNSSLSKNSYTPPMKSSINSPVMKTSVSSPQKKSPSSPISPSVNSITSSLSKMSTTTSTKRNVESPKPRIDSFKKPSSGVQARANGVKKPADKAPPVRVAPPDPNFVPCKTCSRFFDPTRIELHEKICKQTQTKKRKPFDPVKHRLQGTEAECYLKKPKSHSITPDKGKKTTWRRKHEEFIAIVRAAREAQAYVAKGGKLSDLPPPPSMSTDELTPCPHCGRKFNEGAAERHIPKCANIRSRPKPVPKSNVKKF